MTPITPKRERFAQLVATGISLADAYRKSFCAEKMKPESVHQEACRLAADPNVASRVTSIRGSALEEIREEIQYGVREAMGEALEAFKVARETQQPGAMVAAATLRSKLNGLLIDRKEVTNTAFAGLSAEQKLEAAELVKREIGRRSVSTQLPAPDVQDVEAKGVPPGC